MEYSFSEINALADCDGDALLSISELSGRDVRHVATRFVSNIDKEPSLLYKMVQGYVDDAAAASSRLSGAPKCNIRRG